MLSGATSRAASYFALFLTFLAMNPKKREVYLLNFGEYASSFVIATHQAECSFKLFSALAKPRFVLLRHWCFTVSTAVPGL